MILGSMLRGFWMVLRARRDVRLWYLAALSLTALLVVARSIYPALPQKYFTLLFVADIAALGLTYLRLKQKETK